MPFLEFRSTFVSPVTGPEARIYVTVTYSSPFATISQDIERQVLHLQWNGVVASAVFRKTLEEALRLLISSQIPNCIYNIKNLRPMSLQDYDWVAYEFIPQLLQSPLKKVAILESFHELEQLNLQHMVYASYTQLSFKLKYVDDIASALKWFAKKKAPLQLATLALESQPVSAV